MQFVAYEMTFPTMSNLYIIILILFARFLAKTNYFYFYSGFLSQEKRQDFQPNFPQEKFVKTTQKI